MELPPTTGVLTDDIVVGGAPYVVLDGAWCTPGLGGSIAPMVDGAAWCTPGLSGPLEVIGFVANRIRYWGLGGASA